MNFSLKDRLRLLALKKAHANIIIVGQWGHYRPKKSGSKLWIPERDIHVSDSFTANFLLNLYESFNGGLNAADANWPQTTVPGWILSAYPAVIRNSAGSLTAYSAGQNIYALAGDATKGMLYSTDATAPTVTDYALTGLIANGSGAGQLSYNQQQASQPPQIINGNQIMFELYRAVTNNSGASITVNKVFIAFLQSTSFVFFSDLNTNVIASLATTGARYQFITQV